MSSSPYRSEVAAEVRDDALERFLRYVRIDTQSARESDTYPSTLQQLELSRLGLSLVGEQSSPDGSMDE